MVGRAVKENQVTAQQMWSRGRVLTMPVCLFSHFSQMTPAALAAPTALTFRNYLLFLQQRSACGTSKVVA